jgi:hypothetical protein
MIVEVLGVPCRVVQTSVPAEIAHPGEGMVRECTKCVIVERPDTKERVIAWGFTATSDFTVSRADPNFDRHRWEIERLSTKQR